MNLKPIKEAINLVSAVLSITTLAGIGFEIGRKTGARYDNALTTLFTKKTKNKKEEA